MKNYEKLLIVMLVITVITSILTVSVCAEEQYTLSGKWSFNEVLTVPDYTLFDNFIMQEIGFSTSVKSESGIMEYYIFDQIRHGHTGLNHIGFRIRGDNVSITVYSFATNEWNKGFSNTDYIDFGETPQTVTKDFYEWFILNAHPYSNECDGSTCPATDTNYDNICDDCGKAFTFNLRNDTYNFNGYYLPSAIEDESGVIVNLNNYWHETLSKTDGNLVILNGESTDNALLYHFSPDVVFSDGQVVTTGKTQVTLYKPSTNENGYLYWKKSATDTWNTSGALVASLEHVDWVANAVTDENGYTAINGDVNFQTPLWVEIQGVTEGEMTEQLPMMGGTMKILVVCGVGLMACLVVLSLFGKRSLIFRN